MHKKLSIIVLLLIGSATTLPGLPKKWVPGNYELLANKDPIYCAKYKKFPGHLNGKEWEWCHACIRHFSDSNRYGDFTMNTEGDGNHHQFLPETVQELGEKWPLNQQDYKKLFEEFKALYATKTRD